MPPKKKTTKPDEQPDELPVTTDQPEPVTPSSDQPETTEDAPEILPYFSGDPPRPAAPAAPPRPPRHS